MNSERSPEGESSILALRSIVVGKPATIHVCWSHLYWRGICSEVTCGRKVNPDQRHNATDCIREKNALSAVSSPYLVVSAVRVCYKTACLLYRLADWGVLKVT